jgi:hypothetical protein
MGAAGGPQPAGFGQGPRVAAIRLDRPRPGRVHRDEVRVGDDHLVAQPFQAPRDPFALGRGLEEDAGPRAVAQDLGEPLGRGADAPLDDLALRALNYPPSCSPLRGGY